MDREQFDALARVLATTGSRRAALGALLGAGLLGSGVDALAKKGKQRKPGRGKDRKGNDRGKDKDKTDRRGNRATAQQAPANCFNNPTCTPGPGKNLGKCDFSGSSTLSNKNLKGANLGSASLFEADASGADLRGANLDRACLTDAILFEAKINAATSISTARFCGTIMPDGSINNRDCGRPTRCCEVCIPVGDECNDATAQCCGGGACILGTCEPAGACLKDADCALDEVCCNGTCVAGDCCDNAGCTDPQQPICNNGQCVGCTASAECSAAGIGGFCCATGECVDGNCCIDAECQDDARPICIANTCNPCATTAQCTVSGKGDICCVGTCQSGACCPAGVPCALVGPDTCCAPGCCDNGVCSEFQCS